MVVVSKRKSSPTVHTNGGGNKTKRRCSVSTCLTLAFIVIATYHLLDLPLSNYAAMPKDVNASLLSLRGSMLSLLDTVDNNNKVEQTKIKNNNNKATADIISSKKAAAAAVSRLPPPPVLPKSLPPPSDGNSDMLSKLQTRNFDVCIVGAGLSGAVIAERYASQLNKQVLIMEKRSHIGGNCYDYMDNEVNLRVSKYGAHLFHTQYKRVWDYVQQFAEWIPYEHKVIGLVDNKYVPIPVNIETVNTLFGLNITSIAEMDQWLAKEQVHYDHEPANAEEVALSRVGPRLYDLVFKPYTVKQWDREPKELGPEVTARIPVRNNFDGRYFGDPWQALPKDGYTSIFEKMFQHRNIQVYTNVDYFNVRDALTCGRTYYTGPIDTYFSHLGWEKLQYRSIDFERKVETTGNDGFFQPAFVVNHPYASANFTRIVEYKHLPNQPKSSSTVYFIERSTDTGEPYYPVPNKRNKDLFAKYQEMALKETHVTFAGRLANYKYFNMDEAILNALELFDKDTGAVTVEKKATDPITVSSEAMLSKLSTRNFDVCIVGAGLSGAVIAERYASQLDKKVLVMEKRNHIGGNCYDYMDKEVGLRVSQYGAHLFHTKHERVWEYVQKFTEWTPYEHKVIGLVDNKYVPIPVNIETVNILFGLNITSIAEMDEWLKKEQVHYDHEPANAEEVALTRVGQRLYDLIFLPYTKKQWAREPKELGPEVTARIPVRNNFDGRYFGDPRQALPTHGYTAIFESMFQHKNIQVYTNVDYFLVRDALTCGRTYYTGPIDTYFSHLGWEKLQYRSIDFERKVEKTDGFFQPAFVVNHPYASADFTRIVEYKHLPNQPKSASTVYFIERSTDTGEPYYPVPNKRNKDLYAKYQEMALKEPNVTFAGRLANYKYFDMDQAILNALELFDKDTTAIA